METIFCPSDVEYVILWTGMSPPPEPADGKIASLVNAIMEQRHEDIHRDGSIECVI